MEKLLSSLDVDLNVLWQTRIEKFNLESISQYAAIKQITDHQYQSLIKQIPDELHSFLKDFENNRTAQEFTGYVLCYEQGFYDGVKALMMAINH